MISSLLLDLSRNPIPLEAHSDEGDHRDYCANAIALGNPVSEGEVKRWNGISDRLSRRRAARNDQRSDPSIESGCDASADDKRLSHPLIHDLPRSQIHSAALMRAHPI